MKFERITSELYGAKNAGYIFDKNASRETDDALLADLRSRGRNMVDNLLDAFYDFDGDLYKGEDGEYYAVTYAMFDDGYKPVIWQRLIKSSMKKSEIIKKYRRAIAAEMVECYRSVLEKNGESQISIYIGEDGEIRTIENAQGSDSCFVPGTSSDRQPIYITTISAPYFDPWEDAGHPAPEDEAEAEEERAEIIDNIVNDYDADTVINMLIRHAEEEEYYERG